MPTDEARKIDWAIDRFLSPGDQLMEKSARIWSLSAVSCLNQLLSTSLHEERESGCSDSLEQVHSCPGIYSLLILLGR